MSGKVKREQDENKRHIAFMEDVLEKAFDTYEKLPEGTYKEQLGRLLKDYLKNNGYTFYIVPERGMKAKYKMLIRDDMNGYLLNAKRAFVSEDYDDYLKDPYSRRHHTKNEYGSALMEPKNKRGKTGKEEVWRDMKNFPSYNAIHGRLVDKLYEEQVPLEVVDKMTINDFRYFIKKNLSKEFAEYRKRENVASKFIKYREFEVFDLMEKNGYEREQINTLIERMQKGEVEGIIPSRKGDNGKSLEFTKHHKESVHNPYNVEKIYTINADKRIAMIDKKFHKWLHALESRYKDELGSPVYEKIMTPPHAAFVLNFEMCIQHDYDDPEKVFSNQDKKKSNLIYLNKIDIMTGNLQRMLQNKNTKSENKGYVINTGRGKARGGR